MKPEHLRVLKTRGRSCTVINLHTNVGRFLLILLTIAWSISLNSQAITLDWNTYTGATGACPDNGSITYHQLTSNPITTDCVDVSVSTSGSTTCETSVIRSINGGETNVLNLSLSGNLAACSQITFTFSAPVSNLVIPILDIDNADEVTSSIPWTFSSHISTTESGNTITGTIP